MERESGAWDAQHLRRTRYHEAMFVGQAEYQDVLDHLAASGLPAKFTQTGGMCAALEVQLETGQTLLVTDFEESLAWDREDHAGWRVGLYPPNSGYDEGPIRDAASEDRRLAALLPLVREVLLHRR